MLAAMDNDTVTAAAAADTDAAINLRPPPHTPSNNRTLSATQDKTLSAAKPASEATFTEVKPPADDAGETTMDTGHGRYCSFVPVPLSGHYC